MTRTLSLISALMLSGSVYAAGAPTRLFAHYVPHGTDLIGNQPEGWEQAIANPNTCGSQLLAAWSLVDRGGGVYDWSQVDNYIAEWAARGKMVGIHWAAAASKISEQMGPTIYSTPTYILTSGAPVIQCHQEIGGGPSYASPPTPDFLDPRVLTPWKAFIKAAVTRYGNDPRVAYMEVPIGGSESFPENEYEYDPDCLSKMNAVGINARTWLPHAIDIVDYVASLHPGVQMLWDLNTVGDLDPHPPKGFPTAVAAEARKFGFVVGNNGFPVSMNSWLGTYTTNAPYIYAETASVLNQGGYDSVTTTLQDAANLGIHTLGLYAELWSIAYDPKNAYYNKYHKPYQTAIQGLSPASGSACRLGPGQH